MKNKVILLTEEQIERFVKLWSESHKNTIDAFEETIINPVPFFRKNCPEYDCKDREDQDLNRAIRGGIQKAGNRLWSEWHIHHFDKKAAKEKHPEITRNIEQVACDTLSKAESELFLQFQRARAPFNHVPMFKKLEQHVKALAFSRLVMTDDLCQETPDCSAYFSENQIKILRLWATSDLLCTWEKSTPKPDFTKNGQYVRAISDFNNLARITAAYVLRLNEFHMQQYGMQISADDFKNIKIRIKQEILKTSKMGMGDSHQTIFHVLFGKNAVAFQRQKDGRLDFKIDYSKVEQTFKESPHIDDLPYEAIFRLEMTTHRAGGCPVSQAYALGADGKMHGFLSLHLEECLDIIESEMFNKDIAPEYPNPHDAPKISGCPYHHQDAQPR